jgi:hypothetical protein
MNDYGMNTEWMVTKGVLLDNPANTFKNMNDTIARLRYIKNVGLENLRKKAVLLDKDATIYDIVRAIEDVSINSGIPLQLPVKIHNADLTKDKLISLGKMITKFWRYIPTYCYFSHFNTTKKIESVTAAFYPKVIVFMTLTMSEKYKVKGDKAEERAFIYQTTIDKKMNTIAKIEKITIEE